jgi:hypothetical protein
MKQSFAWSEKLRAAATPRWARLDVPSGIARLLREVSYDNFDGRGHEDVLTTEIFGVLDLLPRTPFLTNVWRSAHDVSRTLLDELISSAPSARIVTLPGDFQYACNGANGNVQPGVIIEANTVIISVEAKRLQDSRFDPTQLARQAMLLSQCAQEKSAILWVVVGTAPKTKLGKLGKQNFRAALLAGFEKLCDASAAGEWFSRFGDRLIWSTWAEIVASCRNSQREISPAATELRECADRLISTMEVALEWHG